MPRAQPLRGGYGTQECRSKIEHLISTESAVVKATDEIDEILDHIDDDTFSANHALSPG